MFWDLVLRLKGNLLTKVERTIEIGKKMRKMGWSPKGTKTEPKRVQIEPKRCQKRLKWSPKGAQNGLNGAQRAPKTSQMAT